MYMCIYWMNDQYCGLAATVLFIEMSGLQRFGLLEGGCVYTYALCVVMQP